MKLFYFQKKIVYSIAFFLFSLIARVLKFVGDSLVIVSSIFIYIRSGNTFYKNFKTDLIFKKRINYKNYSIVARINNFWDFWRTRNYEKYPIDLIINEKENYNIEKKKIIFYEIGANVGYSSLFISKIINNAGKVFAFEIDPTNFKTLTDNIILNEIKNLIPFNIGVSSENKVEKFFHNTKHLNNREQLPASSMGMHSLKFDKKVHKENVFCFASLMKFNELMRIFNLPKPTHLYIDTYGVEEEIIKSVVSCDPESHPEFILVDIEEKIDSFKDSKIVQVLEKNKYKLVNWTLEKGFKEIPDSYKSIFKKI